MEFIYFILSAAGLTQILVYGKIFDKIRPTTGWFGQLFSCSMCTGFWSGIFLWAANSQTELFTFDHSLVTGLVLGCVSSLVSYFFDAIIDDHGIKVDHG
tara:strand:- start:3240 stop:3536 length:297 start_codon:yes stop_codon:yes gene_type:complete